MLLLSCYRSSLVLSDGSYVACRASRYLCSVLPRLFRVLSTIYYDDAPLHILYAPYFSPDHNTIVTLVDRMTSEEPNVFASLRLTAIYQHTFVVCTALHLSCDYYVMRMAHVRPGTVNMT